MHLWKEENVSVMYFFVGESEDPNIVGVVINYTHQLCGRKRILHTVT
jgi:hypothetical protein